MVRCYAVFNVAQADGLQLERKGDDREHAPEWKAHQTAERVIQESGIHVAHVRGDRAFYNLQSDTVTLPEREQFATANGYYQTALHELGHATGHPERMDRDTLKQGAGHFGSVEYAREELGLSGEETAFYDALAEKGSAREAMHSDTLRLMARELTEMVKKMPKLDWTQRESVRASLRRNVRRLLAKYGYPPDLAEDATQLVLRQAELSTENSE